MKRKSSSIVMCILLVGTVLLGCNTGGDKGVNIRDSLLEEAIREKLYKPEGFFAVCHFFVGYFRGLWNGKSK